MCVWLFVICHINSQGHMETGPQLKVLSKAGIKPSTDTLYQSHIFSVMFNQ